jgi:hypothetical protein
MVCWIVQVPQPSFLLALLSCPICKVTAQNKISKCHDGRKRLQRKMTMVLQPASPSTIGNTPTKSQILRAVLLDTRMFWNVMSCPLVNGCWCFKGSQCLHLQDETLQAVYLGYVCAISHRITHVEHSSNTVRAAEMEGASLFRRIRKIAKSDY